MFLECCICGKMTEISKKDKKYIIESEEFTCSPDCIKGWLHRNIDFPEEIPGQRLHNIFVYSSFSDMQYRSIYEKKFAYFISEELKVPFGYEMLGFDLSVGTYTPDFWIQYSNIFIETKGIIGIGFRKKLKRFREEYPSVKLLFVPWILKDYFYKMPTGGVIK